VLGWVKQRSARTELLQARFHDERFEIVIER
jgi:hypothetical protein